MERRGFLAGGAAALLAAAGRGRPAAAAADPHDANLVTVGNSLIDQSVDMAHFFARARGGRGTLTPQSIPGAPLQWNWDHAAEAAFDGRARLAAGGQDVLMAVECVPFRHIQGPGDAADLRAWERWSLLAARGGVRRVLVVEAWHDLGSGRPGYQPYDRADPDAGVPWRERIDFARPYWERIVDRVEASRGAPPATLVPAGRLLADVHDDIRRGAAPAGLGGIGDLFSDSIHPNTAGRYAVACAMYACLYRRSPEGLPAATADLWDRPIPAVPPRLAGYLQRRAWASVRADPRAGLA
jgi:hypothetical protein